MDQLIRLRKKCLQKLQDEINNKLSELISIIYGLINLMKNYFKSITKSLYQKVVEDEYIEPITQTQIYSIINKKTKSSNQFLKQHKSYFNQQENSSVQILQNIERFSLISPQRQFKLIGQQYSFQVINYRVKQLKGKNQAVKQYMLSSYNQNLQCIESALIQIQDTQNLTKTKQKSTKLKDKINRLQQLVNKTMKITKLNIKIKNIKDTLKILQKIPNIKKMSLFQLKNINLVQLNQFKQSIFKLKPDSGQKQLKCIQNLQYFIDKASSEHLRVIISSVTQCLTIRFQNHKYQQAIKNFIISKSTVQYQKLFTRLVQGQIRDKIQEQISRNQHNNKLFLRCQRYLTILINIFKIFRWHRYNLAVSDISQNIQQKIRDRKHSVLSNRSDVSQQKGPVINLDEQNSIKINTQQIKNHICSLMDHCLKQQIQQILFNDSIKNQQIFQLLVLINRFYQLSFSFSSYMFLQSKNQIKQILMRKCYKLQQKGLKDFNEALGIEEGNQWNRLPVLKNFRYKNIQKTIQKVKKLSLYQKIPNLTCDNYKFLNFDYRLENQQHFQLKVAQQKQEDFQLIQFRFPLDKLQRMNSFQVNQTPLPEHQDPQVVFCQSSVTILNYFDQFLSMYFYFPIQEIRSDILDKMSFYLQYYIHYIFETFLSDMYKKFFFQSYDTIEQKYLQVRTKKLYENINKFLIDFRKNKQNHQSIMSNGNNTKQQRRKMSIQLKKYKNRGFSFIKKQIKQSRVSQQNMVKARAIATDSMKFLLAYFQHILAYLQKYTIANDKESEQLNQKQQQSKELGNYIKLVEYYKQLQIQISDLLLTDNVPATTKIDFVVPIIKKIKWHEIQNSKQVLQYGMIILKNIKQVYEKMRSMSKGQIPFYIVDKIFSFYWKTQLTFLTKTFLDEHVSHKQKGGKMAKSAFQKMIDMLYEGLVEFFDDKYKNKQSYGYKERSYQYNQKRIQPFKTAYIKIKNIFPILFETNWLRCKQMIEKSLANFEFIYKIQVTIMKASECCSGLSQSQLQEKHMQIDQFIKTAILK